MCVSVQSLILLRASVQPLILVRVRAQDHSHTNAWWCVYIMGLTHPGTARPNLAIFQESYESPFFTVTHSAPDTARRSQEPDPQADANGDSRDGTLPLGWMYFCALWRNPNTSSWLAAMLVAYETRVHVVHQKRDSRPVCGCCHHFCSRLRDVHRDHDLPNMGLFVVGVAVPGP
eukprot:3114477-Rhodomonas_salina.1